MREFATQQNKHPKAGKTAANIARLSTMAWFSLLLALHRGYVVLCCSDMHVVRAPFFVMFAHADTEGSILGRHVIPRSGDWDSGTPTLFPKRICISKQLLDGWIYRYPRIPTWGNEEGLRFYLRDNMSLRIHFDKTQFRTRGRYFVETTNVIITLGSIFECWVIICVVHRWYQSRIITAVCVSSEFISITPHTKFVHLLISSPCFNYIINLNPFKARILAISVFR